jgi:hypothetical protein
MLPTDDPLISLEERLRSWHPSTEGLDRNRVLFEAGRVAGQREQRSRSLWTWKLATAAAVVLSVGLGLGWYRERAEHQGLRLAIGQPSQAPAGSRPIESVRTAVSKSEPRPVDPNSYLALMRRVTVRTERPDSLEPKHDANRPSEPPDPAVKAPRPLRPRDIDRVISL